MKEFGFTNAKSDYDKACAFRDAAVADGWAIKGTYEPHESVSRASSLSKDGFKMMILTRETTGKWNYEAQVNIWGPDSLCIMPPEVYDMAVIRARLRYCGICGKDDVDTHRFGFAGRCCKDCLPAMQKEHEYLGWTN